MPLKNNKIWIKWGSRLYIVLLPFDIRFIISYICHFGCQFITSPPLVCGSGVCYLFKIVAYHILKLAVRGEKLAAIRHDKLIQAIIPLIE